LHAERRPARRQYFEAPTADEEVSHRWRRCVDLLAIVEHKERAAIAERGGKGNGQSRIILAHPERLGDCRKNQGRVA